MAEALRSTVVQLLTDAGLSSRAHRLQLSGYEGYPDEEDFLYLAMASGVSFENEQPWGILHYGTSPIAARVVFRKVTDGAGHSSPHYDLSQIYRSTDRVTNGRRRLRRKTPIGGFPAVAGQQERGGGIAGVAVSFSR